MNHSLNTTECDVCKYIPFQGMPWFLTIGAECAVCKYIPFQGMHWFLTIGVVLKILLLLGCIGAYKNQFMRII